MVSLPGATPRPYHADEIWWSTEKGDDGRGVEDSTEDDLDEVREGVDRGRAANKREAVAPELPVHNVLFCLGPGEFVRLCVLTVAFDLRKDEFRVPHGKVMAVGGCENLIGETHHEEPT